MKKKKKKKKKKKNDNRKEKHVREVTWISIFTKGKKLLNGFKPISSSSVPPHPEVQEALFLQKK